MALALTGALSACDKPDFEGAAAEVKPHNIKLDLPPVPDFNLPSENPDGTHPVDEMRLRGKRYLGQQIKVKGHVIWIYDCATAIRTPEMTEKEVAEKIAKDPTVCDRPSFYVGASATDPTDKGVWVVEVPRAPRKDEERAFDDETLAAMRAAFDAVPAFKVGDEVVVAGQWALKSPKGFRLSDGLLVFEAVENMSAPKDPEKEE